MPRGYAHQLVGIACGKFHRGELRKVISPSLEAAARGGMRWYGAGLRQLQGMGPKKIFTVCRQQQ